MLPSQPVWTLGRFHKSSPSRQLPATLREVLPPKSTTFSLRPGAPQRAKDWRCDGTAPDNGICFHAPCWAWTMASTLRLACHERPEGWFAGIHCKIRCPKNATKSNVSHQNKRYCVCSSPQPQKRMVRTWGLDNFRYAPPTYGPWMSILEIFTSHLLTKLSLWPCQAYFPWLSKPWFFCQTLILPPFGRVSPSLGQIYFFCPSLYPGVHGYCEGEVSNLYQFPSCLARHMASAFTIFPANCSKLTHPHSIPTNLVCVVVYNDVYSFSDVHVLLPGHWHLSYLSPTQLRPSRSGHAPATAKPGGIMMLLWRYRARSSPILVWKNMSKPNVRREKSVDWHGLGQASFLIYYEAPTH